MITASGAIGIADVSVVSEKLDWYNIPFCVGMVRDIFEATSIPAMRWRTNRT